MKEPRRLLAIAVGFGRVAQVFLVDGALTDWRVSRAAGATATTAARQARIWFEKLRPEVVVTEQISSDSPKRARSRAMNKAIMNAAAVAQLYDIAVPRVRSHANKHAEAAALAKRFPELAPQLPRPRRAWDAEPRNLLYFEALALAVSVIDRTAVASTDQPPSK